MEITELIEEMREVKGNNPTLDVSDVLRIFHIQALKDQTEELRRGNNQ